MEKSYLHLLLRIFCMHGLLVCFAMNTSSITSDQNALLALKNITVESNQALAQNWTAASSVCEWIGVTCGSRHLRVIALNVSNMGLMGAIPPQLGNLSFLISLDLSRNNFHGDLPHEFAQLRRLKLLNLGCNNLTGFIPKEIGNLTMLQRLDLSGNYLTEYGLEGSISTKCDVYSYGIMLMEVFTGVKPTDDMFGGSMSLRGWVKNCFPHSLVEVIDASVLRPDEKNFKERMECFSSIMEVALNCTTESLKERSNISDVLAVLDKIKLQLCIYV